MSDFAAVGRQRIGRLHVFEEYGALRGPDEGGPVRRLPCLVVYPEFSKRALQNGSHGSPLSRKPIKQHDHKRGACGSGHVRAATARARSAPPVRGQCLRPCRAHPACNAAHASPRCPKTRYIVGGAYAKPLVFMSTFFPDRFNDWFMGAIKKNLLKQQRKESATQTA